jgi:hypothetical protein
MTDPKDKSDQGPLSDSAELFESLFREAVVEDEQKPRRASRVTRGAKPNEEPKRKIQDRPQQAPRAAKDAVPPGRRGDAAKKGNGIKPRPSHRLKAGGMTQKISDLGPPGAGTVEKKGSRRSGFRQLVLLLILLMAAGVFAASHLGYVDLGRYIGRPMGEDPQTSSPEAARIKHKREVAQPVPAKPVPKKSETEIAPPESLHPEKRMQIQDTQQGTALSEDMPARIEAASPRSLPEATEVLPEPVIQPTLPGSEAKEAPASQPGPVRKAERSPLQDEPTKYPFSIFLGSFMSLDRTRTAVAIYEKDYGISAYWVRVDLGDKGTWYRVFTGYFQGAEEAAAFFKDKELKEGEVRKTKYSMLIGEYATQKEAEGTVRRLSQIGYSSYFVPAPEDGVKLYSGVFNAPEGARRQHAELASKGIKSRIVER